MSYYFFATLNTWGNISAPDFNKRALKICKYFNENPVDVLNLQEVFTYGKLKAFQENLTSLPYCSFQKSFIGPRGGLVTFSKFPIEKFVYSEFKNKLIKGSKNIGIRITGKGILKTYLLNMDMVIVNTHLSPNYVSPSYRTKEKDREKYDTLLDCQINELENFIQEPAIITGDFNIAKGSPNYQKLIKLGFTDLFLDYNDPTFREDYAAGDGRCYQIDYIFSKNKKLKISSKEEIFKDDPVSDHIGLKVKMICSSF